MQRLTQSRLKKILILFYIIIYINLGLPLRKTIFWHKMQTKHLKHLWSFINFITISHNFDPFSQQWIDNFIVSSI